MKKLKEKIPHWNLRVIFGKKTTNGLPDLPGVSAKELPEQPTKIKRKRMSRKKKIVLAVLITVIIIAGFWFWMSYNRRRAMEAIRESASQVETVQVTRQNLIDSISVTGTIASADARDVSASASNVEVLEVNYDVGDYVNAGDVIVVLDSSSLEDSLEQAQNSQALSLRLMRQRRKTWRPRRQTMTGISMTRQTSWNRPRCSMSIPMTAASRPLRATRNRLKAVR